MENLNMDMLLKAVDFILVIAIMGITEGVKRAMPEKAWRFVPVIPILLGTGAGWIVTPAGENWRVVAKTAVLYAGAASLSYELLRTTVFKWGSKSIVPIVLLALFLSACSTGPQSFGELRPRLSEILASDLDAALADAQAHGDKIAETCYTALKSYIGQPSAEGGENRPEIKGVISTYQRVRNVNQGADKGVPTDLKLACSALVVDGEAFVGKMALMAAPGGGGVSWLGNLWPW